LAARGLSTEKLPFQRDFKHTWRSRLIPKSWLLRCAAWAITEWLRHMSVWPRTVLLPSEAIIKCHAL